MDAAFAGLEIATTNAEKNLRSARELFVNFLNSIFKEKGENWRRTCIQDVCLSIVDCPNRTAPKLNGPSPFKMIRTTNVRNGRVSLDNVNYVSEATYHRWTRRQVPHRGDVLLTREAPLGEVGMLRTDDKVFLGQRLVSYRANPAELDNHFLLFALRSLDLQRQIKAFGSGATVQHMRVPDTKALLLSLPPLATQKRIVADLYQLLDASDGLAEKYLRKLGQLAQLKQSILQRAFSGELTSVPSETISEAAE
nr:restriction endonuclease subunit S [Bradyrhizobium sp. 166]